MGFLKFLFVVLLVYYGLRLFWQLFGVRIFAWLMQRFLRRMQRDFEKMQDAQRHNYGSTLEQEIRAGNVYVRVPKQPAPDKRDMAHAAEEVEFEDIKP